MVKERRAGLGVLDRLVILLAWIVTCGLVYVLGFYVGRGANDRRLGLDERVVKLPVTSQPPPAGERPKSASEFTFYDTLGAGDRASGRSAGTSPPPTVTGAARVPVPAAAAAPPPPRPEAVASAAPVRTPPPRAEPPPAVPAARPPAAVPPPAAPGAPPPGAPARVATATPVPTVDDTDAPPPGKGGWSVQASPTQDRGEAEGLAQQLKNKGYETRIVRVLRNGETWYRVQVGRFATAQQANETMRKLREREGVSHVFIGSE
jgi:cell division protein FtsN